VRLARRRAGLLPPVFFLVACLASTVGPGAIASTALVAPLAMSLAPRQGAPQAAAPQAPPAPVAPAVPAPEPGPATPPAPRFEEAIQAFLAADRVSPPPKHAILFVGSSIFRQWTNVAEQMAPLRS